MSETTNPTVFRLMTLIIRFAGTQGVVQILGFVTGILIVRSLDKPDYAQYSVATSLIASMTLLSDSGISSALLSRGGTFISDRKRLSSLFTGAMRFRRKFGIFIIFIGDTLLIILLLKLQSGVVMAIVYALIVTMSFWWILTKGIVQNHLRLSLDFKSIQRVSLLSGIIRTLAVASLFFANVLDVTLLLFLGLFIASFEALQLRKSSAIGIDYSAAVTSDDFRLFRANLRKTLPMNVFIVLQGQALYFLIGFRGNSEVLAEISAMSRFSLVFVILNSVVTDIGVGLLARKGGSRSNLAVSYLVIIFSYLIFGLLLISGVVLFDSQILGLLGADYVGLGEAFIVVCLGAAAINFGNAMSSLNHARGWIDFSWLFIPFTLAWLIYGIFFIDMNSILQASIFMAMQAVPNFFVQLTCFAIGIRKHSSV